MKLSPLPSVPLGTSESELFSRGGKGDAEVLFSSTVVVPLSLDYRVFHLYLLLLNHG